MRQKIRIAFDPGKKGGIAALYEDGTLKMQATPTTKGEIDTNRFKDILLEYCGNVDDKGQWESDLLIVVEDVHSIFGTSAKSNFQFGRALGILEGMISALDIPFVKVAPKKWQEVCFVGIPKQYKPAKVKLDKAGKEKTSQPIDTKAMALLAAKRLFPGKSFLATERSKKEHDGIIDAVLMCYYLKTAY